MIRLNLTRDRARVVRALGLDVRQYSRREVLWIWLLATLPLAGVAWGLVPAVQSRLVMAPVKVYWLLLPLATAAQVLLLFWLLWREEGRLSGRAIVRRLRLNLPRARVTGDRAPARLWWALPWALFLAVAIVAGIVAFTLTVPVRVALDLLQRVGAPGLVRLAVVQILSPRPEYAAPFALMSPVFAGQWWWGAFIVAVWACGAFVEELIFRGALLPAMRRKFGRWRGATNAILFALYHVHRPWAMPFRAIEAIALARPAVRLSSTIAALAVRCGEGVVVLALVLFAVLTPPFRTLGRPLEVPTVTWHPAPAALSRGVVSELPPKMSSGGIDLRGADLSAVDLRGTADVLGRAWFDDRTIWPGPDRLPAGFDVARIMELGKEPGLGVRRLHASGITGLGIGIGIVDRPLLTGHEEYRTQLDWYEEIDTGISERAHMHGAAVASLAVGRTVGVAPGARLYYIGIGESGAPRDLADRARGVRRLLEINRRLPEGRKIQVISMSMGWSATIPGCDEMDAAVREAQESGVFFVSSNLEPVYGFKFNGLGRDPLANPDLSESYGPGLFWVGEFFSAVMSDAANVGQAREFSRDRLLVPMDSRTTASQAGNREYVFYGAGGWSWAIPYLAGVYALAAQVNPVLTPERFWSVALSTGRTVLVARGGQETTIGPIIDPPALVAALGR